MTSTDGGSAWGWGGGGGSFNLDVVSVPSVACMLVDYSYTAKLMLYTLTPIAMLLVLAIPSVVSALHSLMTRRPYTDAAFSSFSFWSSWFVFLIYPIVSVTVLATFSCKDLGILGSFLLVDLRLPCPASPAGSPFDFRYALGFVFIYPVGVPLAMYMAARACSVPRMAKYKVGVAQMTAALVTYREATGRDFVSMFVKREREQTKGWGVKPVDLVPKKQVTLLLAHDWGSTDTESVNRNAGKGTEQKSLDITKDRQRLSRLLSSLIKQELIHALPISWAAALPEVEDAVDAKSGEGEEEMEKWDVEMMGKRGDGVGRGNTGGGGVGGERTGKERRDEDERKAMDKLGFLMGQVHA